VSDDAPLRAALRQQARSCEELGSPFTARLLRLLADGLAPDTPVVPRLFGWPGASLGPGGDSVPLRLAGALHALVLSGTAPALARAYPPHEVPDAQLRDVLLGALRDHAEAVDRMLDSPPQTNEVARSAALIAAAHWLYARHPLPLVLSELGASAGLNLLFDRYAVQIGPTRLGPPDAALTLSPDWTGPVPTPAPVSVTARRGVDLRPIDLTDPAARLRLRAYVWADQPDRRARLDQALALPPAPLDAGDAAPWLARRLAEPRPGALHLVFHTVAWQYFPPATQAACRAALADAGARATPDAPLAHLAMEHDGTGPGAALTLTLWPGPSSWSLGRADFHGRSVAWDPRPA
jgi:hypothetical protein